MQKALFFPLKVSLCTVGCLYASSSITHAQVTSDGTVNTQVNQDGNIAEIIGGETRDGNLFHSFQDFSVGTGNEAFFNNANDISNIFSRVTGGNISNIDGLIRANGSASLFLINPAGIIFGESARLDIGGSFYGSTASSILFEDGEFSATDLDNPPLLTVKAPIGLNFRDEPGDIINRSVEPNPDGITNAEGEPVGIQVQDGENIGFIGGRILLENGNLTAKGGNIELGSVGGNGQVQINQDADNLIFNYDSINVFGNIRLENSILDVSAGEDGSINFNAQNIDILDSSAIDAGIASGFGSANSQAGDIVFRATESITISNSFVFNFVSQDGIGNSGNVIVEAESLNINDGAQFGSLTLGQGNAGDVVVNTNELVEVVGRPGGLSFLGSSVQPGAEGNAGNLTIDTQSLIVRDGSQLSTSTQGNGNAGNLTINAPSLVELKGEAVDEDGNAQSPGGIFSQIDFRTGAEGTGGNLTINTERLSVSDGSRIQVATFGQGDAGELIINASEIDIFNTGSPRFFTAITAGVLQDPNSETLPIGNGGRLFIETNRLSVRDGARISANVQGEGDGGDISITAMDLVEIIGTDENDISSFISAEVAPLGVLTPVSPEDITGNGGSVAIETRHCG